MLQDKDVLDVNIGVIKFDCGSKKGFVAATTIINFFKMNELSKILKILHPKHLKLILIIIFFHQRHLIRLLLNSLKLLI